MPNSDNNRREFLKTSVSAAVGLGCLNLRAKAQPFVIKHNYEDAPNTHNMMLVGTKAAFLSHLPMFSGPEFESPHRFQVILEATFNDSGRNLTDVYFNDRMKNPTVKMYTLNPDFFVLSRLDPKGTALKKFRGSALVRGHLERGGKSFIGNHKEPPEGGAFDVNVVNVVHFHEFDPKAAKPTTPEYLLFGKGSELFLAHLITKPNDFDQIISVKMDQPFTDDELREGRRIVFFNRANTAKGRLKENVRDTGMMQIPGAASRTVQVEVVKEFYFEEGELSMPPLIDQPTEEERKSGFQD